MGKTKKWKKIFWVTKRGNEEITNRGRFYELQIGQERLRIGAALGISNRGKKIKNRGKKISNRGRDYKWGQGLQISAE